ncbi:MAG TPA: O-antigen ligase family protein [Acidisarcina sp.]
MIPALIIAIFVGALATFVALRWSVTKAVLWVYLPVLLWFPLYFFWGIGGLPINASTLAGIVLVALVIKNGKHPHKFTLMDLWVFLFVLSMFNADARRHSFRVGTYAMLGMLLQCALPYFLGKMVIEQTNSRDKFVKLIVISLACVAFISVYEFRMTFNPFQTLVERIGHYTATWPRQRRWGFARIAGPYAHSIDAGMVFTIGIMFQIWLVATKGWWTGKKLTQFGIRKMRAKIALMSFLVCLGLFMTQSRGPWVGCCFGLIVAGVGLTRNRKRSAIIAGILLVSSVSTFYTILNKYTDAQASNGSSIEQQDAVYRRELLTTYTPLIKEGGIWGWGNPAPTSSGIGAYNLSQPSIDNEWLRVTVAQGYVGITIFLLLFLTSIATLIKHCVILRRREDYIFAYAMLGLLVATAFSLTTVFLGQPMMELLFFIFGWSMSIKPSLQSAETAAIVAIPRFTFEKVYA